MINKARCESCKSVIESTFRHDFVACDCGAIFVDGGRDYLRCGWNIPSNFTRLFEDGTEENLTMTFAREEEERNKTTLLDEVAVINPRLEEDSVEKESSRLLREIQETLQEIKRIIHAKS